MASRSLEFGERRQEQRQSASGTLMMQTVLGGQWVPSHLVDTSAHGFCIKQHSQRCSVGQQVRALFPWGETLARVAWVRDTDERAASAFVELIQKHAPQRAAAAGNEQLVGLRIE